MTTTINKPRKTKKELLNSLDKLKIDSSDLIKEYDLHVSKITDGFKLEGSKKIVFIEATVDLDIIAEDGKFVINYETKNVPQGKIDKALTKVKEILAKY
ncbi:MAG: hypothetical protein M3R36_06880 [Bacteroidota bacterium]|nr:hypothetical protein [Bacteroidota bacterium]